MERINLIAGLDIGNGYVKGKILGATAEPEAVDICSSVAYVTDSADIKRRPEELDDWMRDLFDNMDVSFHSPLVTFAGGPDSTRRLCGARGLRSGNAVEEFIVDGNTSKAMQPLSAILVLSCLAGKALKDYWAVNHKLPVSELDVHAMVALALPISEYKSYRQSFTAGFMNTAHVVQFYDFEQPVSVRLTFDNVQVMPEGGSANFAISQMGTGFIQGMLNDVKRMDESFANITPEDILAVKSTLGIDIGEGTTNFPVFVNGAFNADASRTFAEGYGTVLNRALDPLRKANHPYNSRKELAAYLQSTPSPLKRQQYDQVVKIVDNEIRGFAASVQREFSRIMSNVSSFVEVVYVYGGGSGPLKEALLPMLQEVAAQFGGVAIMYLDSQYSRKLNREGLYIVASAQAQKYQFLPGFVKLAPVKQG